MLMLASCVNCVRLVKEESFQGKSKQERDYEQFNKKNYYYEIIHAFPQFFCTINKIILKP